MFDNLSIRNLGGVPVNVATLKFPGIDQAPAAPLPGALVLSNDPPDGGAGDEVFTQENLDASYRITGGAGFDTVDYSRAEGSNGATAGIDADLKGGTVRKYQNGRLTGTDTLISIEHIIGTRYNDTLAGSANADALDGDAGDDVVNGGGGNDTLKGGDGNDRFVLADWTASSSIDGGNGVDTLDYSELEVAGGLTVNLAIDTVTKGQYGGLTGTDTISNIEGVIGTRLDDTLFGNAGANRLDGGAGDDTLSGAAGSDIIQGGAGHDHIVQDSASVADSDSIDGGAGDDRLSYMNADFSISVDLSSGKVLKMRGAALGLDFVSGMEHVIGSKQNDSMIGSAGADDLGGYEGDDRISSGAGNDIVRGYLGDDTLRGEAGNDTLDGGDGADDLRGGDGNDSLAGGAGADWLVAGAGNNAVNGGDGDDDIVQDNGLSIDTLDGGDGLDTVDYRLAAQGLIGLVVNLAAGTATTNNPLFPKLKDRLSNIEGVMGTARPDQLIGDAKSNMLLGDDGNDLIDGAAGDDALDGESGNDDIRGGDGDDVITQSVFRGSDKLDGGNGDDTADYSYDDEINAAIYLDLNAGSVVKTINNTKVGADTIVRIERVIGTASDDGIMGSSRNESLAGGGGHDTLSSGGGNDSIGGEDGNDHAMGAWNGSTTIHGGSGTDTLDYRDLRGPAGNSRVEIDLQTGTVRKIYKGALSGIDYFGNIEQLIGSQMADILDGDSGANSLGGDAGNDSLDGHGGNDFLVGADGDDFITQDSTSGDATIDGGVGFDKLSYAGIAGSIKLDLALGTAKKYLDGIQAGTDSILNIEQVIGGAGNDSISGADKGDNLNGREGNDSLAGQAGNDLLDGGSGADVLAGGDGSDMLLGRDGNDTLGGGAGNDLVRGDAGDDRIMQDGLNDSDYLEGGDGLDTVDYSEAQALTGPTGHIEANLATGSVRKFGGTTLLGTDTIRSIEGIIGTRYNDVLKGSAIFDSLDGGAGNDTLDGVAGNDVMKGGDGDDRIVLSSPTSKATVDGGDGFDMLDYGGMIFAVTIDLFGHQVTKKLSGQDGYIDVISNIEGAIGTSSGDLMSDDFADNRLEGGAGSDIFYSSAGNDTLLGGSGDDQFHQQEESLIGNDAIDGGDGGSDAVSYLNLKGTINMNLATRTVMKYDGSGLTGTDTVVNVEAMVGTTGNDTIAGGGSADHLDGYGGNDLMSGAESGDWLFGGSGHDSLNGNAGNDNLEGDNGDDLITGGTGSDTLKGSEGADRFMQDAGSGNDSIDGGDGIDTVDYGPAPASIGRLNINLATGKVTNKNGSVAKTDTLIDIENVVGSHFDDKITGDAFGNSLFGALGNDSIDGGGGNDTLVGGVGNDLYTFGMNFGRDRVFNVQSEVAEVDTVQFTNAAATDVLFQRSGNSLLISIAGSADKLTFGDWYGAAGAVENLDYINQFKAGNVSLSGSVVNELVTVIGAPPVSMADLLLAA